MRSGSADALSALITIAGNGPELHVIEQLTRAFEQAHLGSVVEIRWDASFHPIHMVKVREADFAVAGQTDSDLVPISIAWDGIALWWLHEPSESGHNGTGGCNFFREGEPMACLGGPDLPIQLIDRPETQHIRGTLERELGIIGRFQQPQR